MKASNKKVRNTCTITHVYDIKSWIAPHLEEIHGHTAPHIFHFQVNHSKKRAELRYKNWSNEPWYPTEDKDGLILLKVCSSSGMGYLTLFKLWLADYSLRCTKLGKT